MRSILPFLLLASLGAGPPSPVPPAPGRQLLDGQFGGQVVKVWGWSIVDGYGRRSVGYYPHENAHLYAAKPAKPAADNYPNYGLNLQEIHGQPSGTVISNDLKFERELRERTTNVPIMNRDGQTIRAGPTLESAPILGGRTPIPEVQAVSTFALDPSWGWVVGSFWVVAAVLGLVGFSKRRHLQKG